jgi:hypothetical protein
MVPASCEHLGQRILYKGGRYQEEEGRTGEGIGAEEKGLSIEE